MSDSLRTLVQKYSHQPNFQSALKELLDDVIPYLEEKNATEEEFALLERLTIPDRVISFDVVWEDDAGKLQTNSGYRVQFNSALGPYKGGLRFDASVNEDILKFLGFEQIFKNSLTGLPLGGGKGGSDFNPKGKSDAEVERFCTAFMKQLAPHIGANKDVPAGDIGVGAREIKFLFDAYKKEYENPEGALTGKGIAYGGSELRTEATGYGAVYFIKEMLKHRGKDIHGMRAVVSGSGNVATHVAEKLLQEGAVPLTLSDRGGYVYSANGLTQEVVDAVKTLKEHHGALKDLGPIEGVTYHEESVWHDIQAAIYVPSATQNEITKEDAEVIVSHGAVVVAEGANMPSTLDATKVFQDAGVLFGPAKAVNAGGVAVSGLEMEQNAKGEHWTREEVDQKLHAIMKHIHDTCVQHGSKDDGVNYVQGANIGGFIRVFEAMKQQRK